MQKEKFMLNGGKFAVLIELDSWGRPIMDIDGYRAVIVDNKIHSMTRDGEPDTPLREEYQLAEHSFDFNTGKFIRKS
jgi:hypothetical protein